MNTKTFANIDTFYVECDCVVGTTAIMVNVLTYYINENFLETIVFGLN